MILQHSWRLWVTALLLTGCSTAPSTPPVPTVAPGNTSGIISAPISQARPWPIALPQTASLAQSRCLLEVSGRGIAGVGSKRVDFTLDSRIAASGESEARSLGTVTVSLAGQEAPLTGSVLETTRAANGLLLKGNLASPQGAVFRVVLLTKAPDTAPYAFVFAYTDNGGDQAYGSVEPLESGAIGLTLCGDAL